MSFKFFSKCHFFPQGTFFPSTWLIQKNEKFYYTTLSGYLGGLSNIFFKNSKIFWTNCGKCLKEIKFEKIWKIWGIFTQNFKNFLQNRCAGSLWEILTYPNKRKFMKSLCKILNKFNKNILVRNFTQNFKKFLVSSFPTLFTGWKRIPQNRKTMISYEIFPRKIWVYG